MKKRILTVATIFLSITSYAQEQGKVRFSLDAGYARRTAKVADNIPAPLKEQIDGLRSGFNFNTHLSYLIKSNWGLGIHYSLFKSSNETTFNEPFIINDIEARTTSDDLSIHFIAPEFLYKSMSENEKHSFISTISVGYLKYKDEGTFNQISADIEGGTIGFGFGLNYDYHITPSVAIGAGAGFITGTLSKITTSANGGPSVETDLPNDQKENLSYFNLTLGLKFYL